MTNAKRAAALRTTRANLADAASFVSLARACEGDALDLAIDARGLDRARAPHLHETGMGVHARVLKTRADARAQAYNARTLWVHALQALIA